MPSLGSRTLRSTGGVFHYAEFSCEEYVFFPRNRRGGVLVPSKGAPCIHETSISISQRRSVRRPHGSLDLGEERRSASSSLSGIHFEKSPLQGASQSRWFVPAQIRPSTARIPSCRRGEQIGVLLTLKNSLRQITAAPRLAKPVVCPCTSLPVRISLSR